MERIRYARDEPIALLRNYLPPSVAAPSTELLEQHGLYELMCGSGTVLRAATQAIGARAATPAEARLLGESRRAPLLTMERTVYDELGDAVEYGNHIYRASRYCFEQSLVAR
jgi:DNA-binding GntR family transcriptional regulator